MAFHGEEEVLAHCIAIVYVLERSTDSWKVVVEHDGHSIIQLVQQKVLQQLSSIYRIRGRLRSTGQVIINVILEKDDTYELDEGDKTCHFLKCRNDVFLLKLTPESNGDHFSVVVQNILRRLRGNMSSPREAWIPATTLPQPAAQPRPVKEQLLNSSVLGNEHPVHPQTVSRQQASFQSQNTFQSQNSVLGQLSRDQRLTESKAPLAPSPSHWYNAQRTSWKNDVQVDSYCERLSDAIYNGNVEMATEISKLMAEQKLSLSIKQKNPKIITVGTGEESFNLRVVVEDRETSGGALAMKVTPNTTVAQLQEEVAERYGFPPKVQKWITGMKMAKPQEKMSDLNIKRKGCTAYLYLVSGKNVGLERKEFERYVTKKDERKTTGFLGMSQEMGNEQSSAHSSALSGAQLPRTTSLPSLRTTGQFIESSASSNAASTATAAVSRIPVPGEAQMMNRSQSTGTLPRQAGIFSATSISDLQRMLSTLGDDVSVNATDVQRINDNRPSTAVEESEVAPHGWICEGCTFVNTPTRPGCEMCGSNRPDNYVVPQNAQIPEQERERLEKERRESEMFQRAGML